jgi:uncharacterized protein YbbC (DUF1343 family)
MPLKFGIDILLKQNPDWKNKPIGLLTNDAAKTNKGIFTRQALIEAGFNITTLFSPEHGISAIGEDGAFMHNGLDDITGLPIISLYSEKYMPTPGDVKDISILIFDVPDAGTRFYTYLWTMTYLIQAAAINNKQIIILDRPNPIGGNLMHSEGPMLSESLSSFIGRFNIPIKHQSTFGELATFFNATKKWNANIQVIKCEGWKREYLFFDWHLPWVNPSPALQNSEAVILYPGLCFFEATNVSVGRGTSFSFEWIGADWFNIDAIKMVFQNILSEDLKIEILKLPISQNNAQVLTTGISIKVIDPYHYDAVLNGLLLLKLIKDIHPNDFKWMPYPTNANPAGTNHLSLLLGIPNAENLFELPLQQWLQQMTILLRIDDWRKTIEPYLLYV